LAAALAGFFVLCAATSLPAADSPPPGFSALFNGSDLTGWRGGESFDHRQWLALPEAKRVAMVKEWTTDLRKHWRAENGELVNDGGGLFAVTEKDYGDFELLAEYNTVAKADSAIYLRGCPQVRIWDYTEKERFAVGADKGSGGLGNNSPGAAGKDPLVLADKPFGEWNSFRIIMVGARVSVWLNDKLVVDHAILENHYDRKTPVPARGPIELKTHGGEIRWRNIFLREIADDEANKIIGSHGKKGFQSFFNGKSFDGWAGPVNEYEVKEGAICCQPGKGGTIYTKDEFGNFVARLEFKLPRGGNNGLAIRYPGEGDAAYAGMCEVQVLDDTAPQYEGKVDPRQYCGSIYGVVAAHRGYLRTVGEWNSEEVTVKGSKITVELNGTVITDADVAAVTEFMDNHPHPGKDRTSGHFGFAGHNDPVCFRNVQIKRL